LIFYGLDKIDGQNMAIVTEGECFHPETELLTRFGWRPIKFIGDEPIATYQADGSMKFEKPIAFIKKDAERLIECQSGSYKSCITPGHNMVTLTRGGDLKKIKAADIGSRDHIIPRTTHYDGPGIELNDFQIRLMVAISADFTLRKGGDIYGCLKKERKQIRFREIASGAGVPFSDNIDSRGYRSFFIRRGNRPDYAVKKFDHSMIAKMSFRQMKVFLDEILYWDGNSVPNRNQIEYSSKEYDNVTFVQTIAHLCGFCATIIPRKNQYGSWYKLSILFGKQHSTISSKKAQHIDWNSFVYCVQVPSGMLMTRYKNSISVSGNCDSLAYFEAGVQSVCSVPNGASKGSLKMEYLDNCIEAFKDKEIIYIATDNDDPGIVLRNELARRLGKSRCRWIDFGDCKDANEYLLKYGKERLAATLTENVHTFPIEGIIRVNDFEDQIDFIYKNGFPKGYTVGHDAFDRHIRYLGGQWTLVVGLPGSGKSEVIDQITMSLGFRHGWKTGMFSSESMPYEFHFTKLAEKFCHKRWHDIKPQELKKAKEWIHEHFYWVNISEKELSPEKVIERYENLVVNAGVKAFVIDPWNQLDHQFNGTETQYINRTLSKITSFVQATDTHLFLVVHPTKPQKTKDGIIITPKLSDAAGSMNFSNKSYNGFVVVRDFETNQTEVHVQKIKFKYLGSIGVVPLNWSGAEGGTYWKLNSGVTQEQSALQFPKSVSLDDMPF